MAQTKQKRFLIRTLILTVLAVAIIYTIYNNATKDKFEVLGVGDEAPDFTLVDLNGEEHRLSDYKGQGVFLNFWGTWCKPCAKEMPAMDRQYEVFKDQGVQILAVNIAQSNFEVERFADQYGLDFPIVIDKTKSVMEAYNIDPLPTTLLINPDGEIEKIVRGEMTEQDIALFMEQIRPE
ncbi:thiol-disulfide oxidoreductase ResA [Paenisporosarcina quisquiliarum]|uniref:Thiol-disulfide oxidoreductase ResA n=1 Tax=Paenisporosarcina quisquiliarum TaxID=365346 RepID=A0A9X3LEC5_9BACL|nr:thiol-disulfide oxidoreductase ResA [Paenisporosarcina quisquiliarum]MCZ8535744.1 thiol-disulfide oxidoreductase ResA [Paenisporosarcina quisquiliarum]